MKLIIVFILLIAIASSSSSGEDEITQLSPESFTNRLVQAAKLNNFVSREINKGQKLKLQMIYNNHFASGRYTSDRINEIEERDNAAERECVKDKMNLASIGEKVVPKYAGVFLLRISSRLCEKDNDEKYSTINYHLKEFSAIEDKVTKIFCLRRKIKELNGADKMDIEECKDVNMVSEEITKKFKIVKEEIQALGIGECVEFDADVLNLKLLQSILLKFEENDEAYMNVSKDFDKSLKISTNKCHDCIMNKINE